MKFQLFTVLFLLGFQVFGQTEGYVKYKFESPDNPISNGNSTVYFNKNQTLYIQEGQDRITENQSNSKQIVTYLYHHFATNVATKKAVKGKQIDENEYVRTEFDLSPLAWEIKEETIEIQGYTCKKAEAISEQGQVTVWFTSAIPVSVGLPYVWGLPGIILKLKYEDNSTVTAQKVVFEEVPASKLQITEGELVSAKKYDKAKSKTEKWLDKMDKMTSQEMGIDADN